MGGSLKERSNDPNNSSENCENVAALLGPEFQSKKLWSFYFLFYYSFTQLCNDNLLQFLLIWK